MATVQDVLETDPENAAADIPYNEQLPKKSTPLPKEQLWIILLIQGVEPICACVIYPFVTRLVRETGITNGDPTKVGYYAGILESLFYVSEALTVVAWGRASDFFGRRPILVAGLAGLTIATIGFGFSTNFWAAVLTRCMQGVFNGNIGVTRSVMGEILDSSNMAEAFALLPLIWAGGFTIGPLIGGSLANISERWPGAPNIFVQFPYLLPCAVAALSSTALFVWSFLSLEETLPSIVLRHKKATAASSSYLSCEDQDYSEESTLLGHSNTDSHYGTTNSSISDLADAPKTAAKPPSMRLVLVRSVLIPVTNHGFLALLDAAYNALLPLVFSSPIPLGGLAFSPLTIGLILGIWSFFNTLFQIFSFARLVRYMGLRTLYICCFASLFVVFAAFPAMSYFAMRAGRVDGYVWGVLFVSLCARSLLFMGYTCTSIFIIEGAPDKSLLGVTNGLGQMVSSSSRAFGPSFASSLYSISLEKHLMNGWMVYWVLLALVALGVRASFLLPHRP